VLDIIAKEKRLALSEVRKSGNGSELLYGALKQSKGVRKDGQQG
jgi:hypothetical protein